LPEHTVLVRSFSKTHGPDLRLAAIGGPAAVVGPIVERRYLGQGWSSRLVQSILLDLLTDDSSRRLVADARATYSCTWRPQASGPRAATRSGSRRRTPTTSGSRRPRSTTTPSRVARAARA